MFKKILIANRGEIALRILRTCREMDLDTVAVFAAGDGDALNVEFSGESYCIGPAGAGSSYLNQEAILTVAIQSGCDAIHPGYGFLSENAGFADRCRELGITFIGPSGDVMRRMGDKAEARACVKAAGVPVVPGSKGVLKSAGEALKVAEKIGFPVLIKASAGGGGRGMRRVYGPEDLPALFNEAQAEALSCFGCGDLYLEKLILTPRHIEFQILADSHGNVIHLGERDCSIQRRNQKLLEETPCATLSAELRDVMGQAAVRAAKAAGYENAGTVEFVLSPDGEFYFIEMNTRIQVEHPVTEMVCGVDLVREQIRVAQGLPLLLTQEDAVPTGHAIECRINAEDPSHNFRPAPGKVEFLHLPGGFGTRVDTLLFVGYEMSPMYDSLAAKVVVYGPTRLEAIKRMRRALEELVIEGFPTTQGLLHQLMHHPAFVRGRYNTAFLEEQLGTLLSWTAAEDRP